MSNIDGTVLRTLDETEFYSRQTRVALRNCGVIDPEDIYEYIDYKNKIVKYEKLLY